LLGFVLALVLTGAATAAPVPEGPLLAFTGLSALKARGFTVRTVGVETPKPLVLVRGSRRAVVPNPLSGSTWSADGSQIAFAASKGSRKGIYLVRADGTGLHFLRGTGGGTDPVFSPDGSKIAFAREGVGKFFFATTPWVANVNGSGARQLVKWHKDVEYRPSSFSPDGSTLAVTRNKFATGMPKALLLDMRWNSARLMARHAAEPAFSPDGSQIAFVHYSVSRRHKVEVTHKDLYVMSTDGMTSRPLTRTRRLVETHPSWDPSGQRIAFNSYHTSKDPIEALFDELLPVGNSIMQINADGSCRQKVLSLRDTATYGAAWRPGPGHEAPRIEC
jgi:Tol biopolymer transport system component